MFFFISQSCHQGIPYFPPLPRVRRQLLKNTKNSRIQQPLKILNTYIQCGCNLILHIYSDPFCGLVEYCGNCVGTRRPNRIPLPYKYLDLLADIDPPPAVPHLSAQACINFLACVCCSLWTPYVLNHYSPPCPVGGLCLIGRVFFHS